MQIFYRVLHLEALPGQFVTGLGMLHTSNANIPT